VGMLKQVIESYLKQDFLLEIIIVDDISTDGTEFFIREMQKRHPQIKYIKNETFRGLPASRNIGVKNTQGEFILFGEDDLYLSKNYSFQLLECMKKRGASIIGGRAIHLFPGETFAEGLDRADRYKGRIINKHLIYGNWLKNTSEDIEIPFLHTWSLIKREVFNYVNYDPGYKGNPYREETDFYISAQKQGFKVFFCPHTYCFHLPREVKSSGGSWTRGILYYKYWVLKNNLRFLRKHYPFLKERMQLRDPFWNLVIFHFAFETFRIFTYLLKKYFPSLYKVLTRKLS
jgi:GT2 family glycosyltransferase